MSQQRSFQNSDCIDGTVGEHHSTGRPLDVVDIFLCISWLLFFSDSSMAVR